MQSIILRLFFLSLSLHFTFAGQPFIHSQPDNDEDSSYGMLTNETKGEEEKGKWHIMMVKYLTGDNDVANANKRESKKCSIQKKVLSVWASWWSFWYDSFLSLFLFYNNGLLITRFMARILFFSTRVSRRQKKPSKW